MKNSNGSDPMERRVRRVRLLSTPTDRLSGDDRLFLRSELNGADFQLTLDLVLAHGMFDDPAVASLLASRWPTPAIGTILDDHAERLARWFGPEVYAHFVDLLATRWEEAEPHGTAVAVDYALSCLVCRVAGCDRFVRVVAADHSPPDIALALLRGSFHDPNECLRILREHVTRNPTQALRVWTAARNAPDEELERLLREVVLDQAFAVLEAPPSDADRWLLQQVWNWIDKNADRTDCVDGIMRRAEAMHAKGFLWARIELSLPESFRAHLARRAQQDGEVTKGTQELLKAALASGTAEAWEHFFACEAGEQAHWLLRTRDLLREGILPAAPDDHFWSRFDAAWTRACAFEAEQWALALRSLPPDLNDRPEQLREQHIRVWHPHLLPKLSEDELVEKVLSRPPCRESSRMLLRALHDSPNRFADERVARFAELAAEIAHDELPAVDVVDLHSAKQVETFLRFHPTCGLAHLRDAIRVHGPSRAFPGWLLDQPWFELAADDALRADVRKWIEELTVGDLADVADRHPAWVSRERVIEALMASSRIPPVELLPPWLDDALFAFARRATSSTELHSFLPRFRDHSYYRKPFMDLVQAQLVASPDLWSVGMMSELLDTDSAWDKRGPCLAHNLLAAGRGDVLQRLLLECFRRWEKGGKPTDPKRAENVHLALARGILLWAGDLLGAGDHVMVERALISIAVLDPPRVFTNDLHKFGERPDLAESESDWVKRLHGMAKAKAKRDATIQAAWDALAELLGGGES